VTSLIRDSILTLWEVATFVNRWEDYSFYKIRDILTSKSNFVFSNDERTICLLLEGKSEKVAHLHLYVDESARGKETVEFIKKVWSSWGNQTGFKYVFNYTKDPRVKLLMKSFGSKRIGMKDGNTIYRTEV